MVDYKTLCGCNKEYNKGVILDIISLYNGGLSLKKRLPSMLNLCKYESENIKQKKIQIAEDSYMNYIALIINYYSGHLFSHPLELKQDNGTLSGYYKEFSEDCDTHGLDFVDHNRNALNNALITGRNITEIIIPDSTATSKEEWERTGGGDLTLKSWTGENVIDWYYKDGDLIWIKLFKKETIRENPFSKQLEKYNWTILTQNKKEVYEIKVEKGFFIKDDENIKLVEEQEHNIGFVPVVDLFLPDGLWIGLQARSPAISNLKSRTAYDYALGKQAFALPVISTDGELNITSMNDAIKIPKDSKFTWTNQPADFLKSLSEYIDDIKQELLRITSRLSYTTNSSSYSLIRSAQSRSEDKSQDHTSMKFFGAIIREHAQRILDMISLIRNDNIKWSVEGFESLEALQLPDMAAISKTLSETDFGKLFDVSETYSKEFRKMLMELTFLDLSENIKDQIRIEIDNSKRPENEKIIENKKVE
jgi:hypothetical protein